MSQHSEYDRTVSFFPIHKTDVYIRRVPVSECILKHGVALVKPEYLMKYFHV